jgi:hypothetical protein
MIGGAWLVGCHWKVVEDHVASDQRGLVVYAVTGDRADKILTLPIISINSGFEAIMLICAE